MSMTKPIGVAPDTKVKITTKYVTAELPVPPNPGYYVSAIFINDVYIKEK